MPDIIDASLDDGPMPGDDAAEDTPEETPDAAAEETPAAAPPAPPAGSAGTPAPTPESKTQVPDEAVAKERERLAQQQRDKADREARERELADAKQKLAQVTAPKTIARLNELIAQGMSEQEALGAVNKEFLEGKLKPETAEERRAREAREAEERAKQRVKSAEELEVETARTTLITHATPMITEDRFPVLASLGAQKVAALAADAFVQQYREHGHLGGMTLEGYLAEEEGKAVALLKSIAANPKALAAAGITPSSQQQKAPPTQTTPTPTAADNPGQTVVITSRDASERRSAPSPSLASLDDLEELDRELVKKYFG